MKAPHTLFLCYQRADDEEDARELEDVARQEPADGEPAEMLLLDEVPMFDGPVPPAPPELTLRVVAELPQQVKKRDGKRDEEEYEAENGMEMPADECDGQNNVGSEVEYGGGRQLQRFRFQHIRKGPFANFQVCGDFHDGMRV